ncbi:Ubiquitin system component Cue [Quillaja saponaria]|uniref:Ubiquitin system component Cue n=1 Tax=Quillaja saponaria TaxID=32244 RepID=A0AAD7VIY6_QUISA|nr:Ubiquitin system component Cue [Quillaja saponaria]
MGFNSVYRRLQEMFPQVDARLLRAVAIEHYRNVDVAVDVILSEIIPLMSNVSTSHSTPQHKSPGVRSEEKGNLLRHQHLVEETDAGLSSLPQSAADEDAANPIYSSVTVSGLLKEPLSTVSVPYDANDGNAGTEQPNSLESAQENHTESEELRSLENAQENHVETGLDAQEKLNVLMCVAGENLNCKQICTNLESTRMVSPEMSEETEPEKGPDMETTWTNNDANSSLTDSSDEWKDCEGPAADNYDVSIYENSQNAVTSDTDTLSVEISFAQPLHHVPRQTQNPSQCGMQLAVGSGTAISVSENLEGGCSFSKPDYTCVEDMISENYVVSQSNQVCKISLLEEIIEEAKTNKKILFSSMESLINLMRKVELQEKAADQAKMEAAQGGSSILIRVKDLKQLLEHAKEANNMHAGEVYGEKATLATEMNELQTLLLSLSDERDKSLAVLDEMHHTLEARLAAAEDLRKKAEQEKLEKEESARNVLAEQEAIMEKVVHESMQLKQEAEENSKLREFLMDRGSIVDMLQGEISVICQDVRLLKEKFDAHLPLSKSFTSCQTSCILASSGSSLKSVVSDLVIEQDELPDVLKNRSSTPSIDCLSPKSRLEDESGKAEHKALDDDWDWDFFD